MPCGTLVVVGSGPGVGTTTAAYFATKGFSKIALLSSNAERIQSDAKEVQKAAPNAIVKTYAVDAANTAKLQKQLKQVETDIGSPEVVLFNVARIVETTIGEESAESITQDFQMMNIGLYTTATWALPLLVRARQNRGWKPCFFLSGGYIYDAALPACFSLSMQKAAQHNLLRSIWKVYGPQGVHAAVVNIGGVVQDSDQHINRGNIARKFWELYDEDKGSWRHQINVPDKVETFDLDERQ